MQTASYTRHTLGPRARSSDYQAALADARTHDVILVPTFLRVRSHRGDIGLPDEQRTFLDDLIDTGKPVVVVSFGNPYLVHGLAQQPAAYVAAYGHDEATQRAAVQALFGGSTFSAKLPVSIPDLYPFGSGLDLPQSAPRRDLPEAAGLNNEGFAPVDSLIKAAIAKRAFPGAAVAIGRGDVVAHLAGYGTFTYDSEQRVTPQTRFDLASLTKVIATTTAAMKLYDMGHLDLDAPVARYLPAFAQNGKEAITLRHLLTHTSGLRAYRPFHREGFETRQQVIDAIMAETPESEPGTRMTYSDFGMITLALVIEQISGQDFATYTREHIFEPLGMDDTGFQPLGTDTTVVPTEIDEGFRKRLVQGEVHDETAWLLGGVAGHAGLFSTAEDLARFAHMIVNGGTVKGQRFLGEKTIRLFTTAVDPEDHTRAIGWDTKSLEGYSSAGQRFGPLSFGHTGFTGTSLWFDPDQKLYVILLTNRVYPSRENRGHIAVRPDLADLAYDAIIGPATVQLPESPDRR